VKGQSIIPAKGRGDSQRTRRSRTGRSFQRSRKQRRIEEET